MIYIYYCPECEYDKDVKHGIEEKPMVVCETCDGEMHKVIRSASFQLKGSGWFKKTQES